jgi:uncharacterized protein (DUF433 family)
MKRYYLTFEEREIRNREIQSLFLSGISQTVIAQKFDLTRAMISAILKQSGLKPRKLKREQWRDIVRYFGHTCDWHDVAKLLGESYETVRLRMKWFNVKNKKKSTRHHQVTKWDEIAKQYPQGVNFRWLAKKQRVAIMTVYRNMKCRGIKNLY